jgi:hypothetical protein
MGPRILDGAGFVTQSSSVPDVSRAVEEIAAIHAHLDSREIYRGWRSIPVALSGLVGLAATLTFTARGVNVDAGTFLRSWMAVGVVALGVGCAEIAWRYARVASDLERRRTRAVMGQLLPALAAGLIVPVALVQLNPAFVRAVPGLWAMCFGLSVFSARPCLPSTSVWAATYYTGAGLVLLGLAPAGIPPDWTVGATFGVGQGLAALLIQVSHPHRIAGFGADDGR